MEKLVLIIMWVFGLVLAKGFWSTIFAIFCPLWAFYLVIEYVFINLVK